MHLDNNTDSRDRGKAHLFPRQRNWVPYVPGQTSGNPGGKPRAAEYREMCRHFAWQLTPELAERAFNGECRPADVEMWKELCAQGGYLPVDRLVSAEQGKWKLALAIMTMEGLPKEMRDKVLAMVRDRDQSLLGEQEEGKSGSTP